MINMQKLNFHISANSIMLITKSLSAIKGYKSSKYNKYNVYNEE